MARIHYTVYKNSLLATILSFLGSAYIMMGALIFVLGLIDNEFEIAEGIFLFIRFVLVGVVLLKIAKYVNEKKTFKLWVKAIRAQGAEYRIKESVDYAVMAYNSYPTKRTLKYISKLNPQVVEMIKPQKHS